MRAHEAMLYLPFRGIDSRTRTTCSASQCDNKFIVANGYAFPGTSGGEDVHIFFFCSEECYLNAVPITAMPSA